MRVQTYSSAVGKFMTWIAKAMKSTAGGTCALTQVYSSWTVLHVYDFFDP